MSDFQELQHMLDSLMYATLFLISTYPAYMSLLPSISESTEGDGHELGPTEIYEYLSQVMYARRSKMNPLWNSILLAGFRNGKRFFYTPLTAYCVPLIAVSSFLGYVDLLGTTYQASTLATGFGGHIAQPLLRKAVEGRESELTEDEARTIMKTSLKVLFYRDARSLNKFQIATVTAKGVSVSDSESLETNWSFAEGIRGYGAQTQ